MWAALAMTAASSITQAMQARNQAKQFAALAKPQIQAMEDARTYEQAALNPDSPHAKALRLLIEAQQRQQVLAAIDQITRSQNRARARGTMGMLVNPERRDEARTGSIADAFARIGQNSGTEAAGRLANAAQSARGRAGGMGGIADILGQALNAKGGANSDLIAGFTKIAQTPQFQDALGKIFGGGGAGTYGATGWNSGMTPGNDYLIGNSGMMGGGV